MSDLAVMPYIKLSHRAKPVQVNCWCKLMVQSGLRVSSCTQQPAYLTLIHLQVDPDRQVYVEGGVQNGMRASEQEAGPAAQTYSTEVRVLSTVCTPVICFHYICRCDPFVVQGGCTNSHLLEIRMAGC